MKVSALLLLCAACAGGRYSHRPRPGMTDASEVAHSEDSFIGGGGVKIFEQRWSPEKGEVRAVLVIVHGLKDHSTRYAEFADRLAQHGWEVHAFDLRGHGSSEGRRVYISSFDDYVQDLDAFVARWR